MRIRGKESQFSMVLQNGEGRKRRGKISMVLQHGERRRDASRFSPPRPYLARCGLAVRPVARAGEGLQVRPLPSADLELNRLFRITRTPDNWATRIASADWWVTPRIERVTSPCVAWASYRILQCDPGRGFGIPALPIPPYTTAILCGVWWTVGVVG
jgi:hypothetical protein